LLSSCCFSCFYADFFQAKETKEPESDPAVGETPDEVVENTPENIGEAPALEEVCIFLFYCFKKENPITRISN
jgi:hypothetical protein